MSLVNYITKDVPHPVNYDQKEHKRTNKDSAKPTSNVMIITRQWKNQKNSKKIP